jgi:magnesium-transporting ATPase (P-type)
MFSNIQKNHARQFGLGQTKTLTENDIEARSVSNNAAEEEIKTEQQAPQRKRYGANRTDAQEQEQNGGPFEESKASFAAAQNSTTAEEEENKDAGRMSPTDMRVVDRDAATEIRSVASSDEFQQAILAQQSAERDSNDVRIAVIGNVDSGKSTMVGVMTKSIMDDGRGSARQKVFNFSHEAANGRTSSIGQEIMGFDEQDNQVQMEHLNSNKNQSWAHVA